MKVTVIDQVEQKHELIYGEEEFFIEEGKFIIPWFELIFDDFDTLMGCY